MVCNDQIKASVFLEEFLHSQCLEGKTAVFASDTRLASRSIPDERSERVTNLPGDWKYTVSMNTVAASKFMIRIPDESDTAHKPMETILFILGIKAVQINA